MELHVFPIPIPPPTSLSTQSVWVFPVHQARALVSCIQPGLVICFTIDNIHVSMLFSRNIPPSTFLTLSKYIVRLISWISHTSNWRVLDWNTCRSASCAADVAAALSCGMLLPDLTPSLSNIYSLNTENYLPFFSKIITLVQWTDSLKEKLIAVKMETDSNITYKLGWPHFRWETRTNLYYL